MFKEAIYRICTDNIWFNSGTWTPLELGIQRWFWEPSSTASEGPLSGNFPILNALCAYGWPPCAENEKPQCLGSLHSLERHLINARLSCCLEGKATPHCKRGKLRTGVHLGPGSGMWRSLAGPRLKKVQHPSRIYQLSPAPATKVRGGRDRGTEQNFPALPLLRQELYQLLLWLLAPLI